MQWRQLSLPFLYGLILSNAGCALAAPAQINVVIRLREPASIDRVVSGLASRLNMQVTVSGQGIVRPAGARGFQVYDDRINFLILPAPVDACSMAEVYDGSTYSVGIVAVGAGAAGDLPNAERGLREAVASVGGSVNPVATCTQPTG